MRTNVINFFQISATAVAQMMDSLELNLLDEFSLRFHSTQLCPSFFSDVHTLVYHLENICGAAKNPLSLSLLGRIYVAVGLI